MGVTVGQLAEHLGIDLPENAFDNYLDGLNERARDILKARAFRLGACDTLVEVASRWNVTRERVRQIESKTSERLLGRFSQTFLELGRPSLLRFTHRIFRARELYAKALSIAEGSRHSETLAGFLVHINGPWKKAGAWLYHETLEGSVIGLASSLAEIADDHGLINTDQLNDKCDGLFFGTAERDQFLTEELGLGHYFGIWTAKDTMRCRVAAALRKLGRPATKDELGELLEHPPQSVGSILGNLPGVVRADRYRWGFSEWIDDVYDGIVGEIEQRIGEYNGSVPVHILLREIPAQFNVAEGSVQAYLASSAFVVENGMARMASGDGYVARSPSKCSDAVRAGDRWGYRSLIYDRHFNGYSLGVNIDVAYANGLRPGDELIVPIEGHDFEASLIWRPHCLNRLVDVGRISEFLRSKGYEAGETLVIIPSRKAVTIIHERDFVDANTPVRKTSLSLFGDDEFDPDGEEKGGTVDDPLFDLLGGN